MKVALCDDDTIFLNSLEKRLEKYDCTIFKYTTAEALKNAAEPFDIAFLDIEFDAGSTGFEAVRFLKIRNPRCIIAFFTNYTKYAIKGYEYRAFRYILKKEPDALIEKRIKEVFREYYRQHKVVSGSYKDKTFAIPIDEIYYIEVINHILKIHTKRGVFELYKQIKDIYEEVREFGFLRCHRSYVVNINYILSMSSDGYFLMNTAEPKSIPIGIRYKDEARERYLNYDIGGDAL